MHRSWLLSGSSLRPLALKQHWTSTFPYGWLWTVAFGPDLQVELLPYAASFTRTWVNQRVFLVQQLGWCRTTTVSSYEHLGTSLYLRELLCRREEVLSVPRISSFWKRSVSPRFLGVFLLLLFWFVFVFWGCVVSAFGRHLAFCFSPVQLENSWPTTRRFDDRPSLERARHELKKQVWQDPLLFRSFLRHYSETINSAVARKAILRRQLQMAWDYAFAWVKAEPPTHHMACPWQILLAVVSTALLWGWSGEAGILAMTWGGLLRAGEATAALRDLWING